ncbi:MAG: hypothetical protein J5518_00435 [Lachnospiraceae bacterium]|nr:hypothetical protein [Lachnospiraceae bacterium]
MRRRTLSYLGDHKMEGALVLSEEIERCFAELQAEARFMACYEKYALDFDEEGYPVIRECSDLTFQSEDLRSIFAGCKSVCVLASTLGIEFERYSKRVMSMDMSHGVVLDAAASAYLEGMTDAYEADLALGAHTIRFAPGYGDLDLSYNAVLLRAINADKRIGISHTGGGLFLPQKSMLGLIGIGGEDGFTADRCKNCRKRDDCGFRKAGRTCYQRDEDTK